MPKPTNICILARDGESLRILYNSVSKYANIKQVIIEEGVSSKKIIRNRIKKLGITKVLGQLIFQVLISPIIRARSTERRREIIKTYKLSTDEIPNSIITRVPSVNSELAREILSNSSEQTILVSGTRIISKSTLDSTTASFINIHAGITPKYRGVHGGYWALQNKDVENFGVTLHYIDKGIDTGEVIAQKHIKHGEKDNFASYPSLQLAEGLILLEEHLTNNTKTIKKTSETQSKLWYHPSIYTYLKSYISDGVK